MARRRLLKIHYESQVGHIGSNLSAIDALLFIHHFVMKAQDRFVLSKGHAAGALYVTLWTRGLLKEEQLVEFHQNDSFICGHPLSGWHVSIPFATGSLGHGLPLSVGMALASKLQADSRHIYCLCSDGEWQEGSNWEALIFACHHKLSNLTIAIDQNGLQGFGSTTDVASMGHLKDRLETFGACVLESNGHDYDSLVSAFDTQSPDTPRVIVLQTIKGKGVSFMEGKMEWHYLPLSDAQYKTALREIGKS